MGTATRIASVSFGLASKKSPFDLIAVSIRNTLIGPVRIVAPITPLAVSMVVTQFEFRCSWGLHGLDMSWAFGSQNMNANFKPSYYRIHPLFDTYVCGSDL